TIPALESALGSHPCGALSSVQYLECKPSILAESDKSQGFGDGIPESINASFLIVLASVIIVSQVLPW
ncbi:MAG: hypothetical protein WBE38_17980, partial [Terracidiphilus sp.]